MQYSLTQFRKVLFQVADQVIETGESVEIKRHGKVLRLAVENPPKKLDRLKPHPGTIIGDPNDLIHMDCSQQCTGAQGV